MLKLKYSHILFGCITYFLSVWLPVSAVSELVSTNNMLAKAAFKRIKHSVVISKESKKFAPSLSEVKPVKEVTVTDLENFDYTANIKETIKVNQVTNKIKYLSVPKVSVEFAKPVITGASKTPETIKRNFNNSKIETNSYEVSYKDIKEQQIETNKPIRKIAWAKISFPKIKLKPIDDAIENIANTKKVIKKEDRISTIASAQEKSPSQNNTNQTSENFTNDVALDESSDELVFFNFTEDGKVVTKEESLAMSDGQQAESLEEVSGISKLKPQTFMATSSALKVNTQKATPKKKKKNNITPSVMAQKVAKVDPFKYIKRAKGNGQNSFIDDRGNQKNNDDKDDQKEDEDPVDIDYACLDENILKRNMFESEYSISLRSITSEKAEFEKIHNFEVRFQDDLDDIIQDYGEGEIQFNYKLNTSMNIRRGVVSTSGHYPTAVDFVFEGVSSRYTIPVFEKQKFDQIVTDLGVPAFGAQVLVELDELTEDVELDVDTKYDAKVFLDTNLNIVNRSEADYSYILFVGVSTGNTIINFRNVHGQDTNKIIYLAPKEIYYEPNFYAEVSTDSISFFEEGLRSKCIGMLDIDSDKIAPWSHEGIVSKKSMNTHNVSKMLYPLGTRKYFDLSHFEKNIFVGRWSEEKVILPNQEYADSILNNFEIEANECMVQVNLSKDVKHINITGLSETGYMNTELRFLDKNGNFYDEVSSHSNRVFIAGEEQGLINIKLEYIDGSKQYLQTFCSESTYLVEQL